MLTRNTAPLEEPQRYQVSERPALGKVIQSIAEIFRVKQSVIIKRQAGRQSRNSARKVAMYMAQQLCDLRLVEISKYFGVNHVGSVNNAISEIRRSLDDDKGLKKQIKQVFGMMQHT